MQGAYRQILPTDLVRLENNAVIRDPDEQVCQVIELVFEIFSRLKSGSQVLQYLRREKVLLSRRQIRGPEAGNIVWKPPSASSIYSILTNPAYAGAFIYGRNPVDKTQIRGARLNQPRCWMPIESWQYMHHDHCPAYISWETYLENRKLLRANRQQRWQPERDESGAIRHGGALLQGIVYCAQLVQQWQQRLERAQYEVHLTRRQYDAVGPDNRLVAAELERRWEAKLQAPAATELDEFEKVHESLLLVGIPGVN